jgi:nitrile hydratase accessory protein
MALALHTCGLFTWPEWAETLAAEIERAQDAGDPDIGVTYCRHWLAALEAWSRTRVSRRRPPCDAIARPGSTPAIRMALRSN